MKAWRAGAGARSGAGAPAPATTPPAALGAGPDRASAPGPETPSGGTFRSLAVPAYRTWFSAALVSNAGTWMQRTAQDWLVLTVLTHDSGTAVGVTTALQFGPVLLVGPWAGAVADRVDRRRVMIATQGAMGALAAVLGLLVLSGTVQLWHVYVLAGALGVVAAFDMPARQTLVTDLVPGPLVPNAVSLNSASFHTGRFIGPAVAGLMIAWWGTGPVFVVNALSFAGVLTVLVRMQADRRRAAVARADAAGASTAAPEPGPGPGAGGRRGAGLGGGLRYLRTRPDLVLLLSAVGVISTFTLNFQVTTALMAKVEFARGSGEYGLLGSVMALGGVAGALLAARRRRPTLRVALGGMAGLGLFALLASLAPTYGTFAVCLVPVGFSAISLMTTMNSLILTTSDPAVRGRVMAVYAIVFNGGAPVGSPLIGAVGDGFGPRCTIAVGAVLCLATSAVVGLVVARRKGGPAPAAPAPTGVTADPGE